MAAVHSPRDESGRLQPSCHELTLMRPTSLTAYQADSAAILILRSGHNREASSWLTQFQRPLRCSRRKRPSVAEADREPPCWALWSIPRPGRR
jgi:hypothetical protein